MTVTVSGGPHPILHWWRGHAIGTVDHGKVIAKVHDDAGWSGRYVFTTLMSAGIAVLGLLLSSPAVVIGAMLISPLMGPIIGLGFALATFDSREIRRTIAALAGGIVLAILFCAAVVAVSPLQNVTPEIAARTRPNLFDLMIALFSALAGAYATIRGREGTIVGVAIATALMPPLAVVGFGLATANWTVFLGASLLFFTNFMTIALTAAVMARLYGFARDLSPQRTIVQSAIVLAVFVALALPLGFALRRIAWEANATRQAREVVTAEFGDKARVSQLDLDYDARPITLRATVLTPHYVAAARKDVEAALGRQIGRPIDVTIEQYRVGTGSGEAEAAEIAAAQANASQTAKQTAASDAVSALADQLALAAGTDPSAVLLDRDARRAVVSAAPLPGAGLAAYRALEARVAARETGWQVTLIPPPVAPGDVTFAANPGRPVAGDVPDEPGAAALATAIWGAKRLNLAITVSGAKAHADAVADTLTKAGVTVLRGGAHGGPGGAVRLGWSAPAVAP